MCLNSHLADLAPFLKCYILRPKDCFGLIRVQLVEVIGQWEDQLGERPIRKIDYNKMIVIILYVQHSPHKQFLLSYTFVHNIVVFVIQKY